MLSVIMVEERPPDVERKAWAKASEHAGKMQAMHWQKHYSPRHFNTTARSRYGHKRRTRRYLDKKAAMFRRGAIEGSERRDLVFLGNLRTAAKFLQVKSKSNQTTLSRSVKAYIVKGKGNAPNLEAEMWGHTPDEDRKLAEVRADEISKQLGRTVRPRRTTIK